MQSQEFRGAAPTRLPHVVHMPTPARAQGQLCPTVGTVLTRYRKTQPFLLMSHSCGETGAGRRSQAGMLEPKPADREQPQHTRTLQVRTPSPTPARGLETAQRHWTFHQTEVFDKHL